MKNKDESLFRQKTRKKTKPPMKRKVVFRKHISFDYIRNIHREVYEKAATKGCKQTPAMLDDFLSGHIKNKIKSYKSFYEQLGLEEPNPELDEIYRSIYGISKDILITDKATTLYKMLEKNRSVKCGENVGMELERLHKLAIEYDRIHFNRKDSPTSDIIFGQIVKRWQVFNYCVDLLLEEISKPCFDETPEHKRNLHTIVERAVFTQIMLHRKAYALDKSRRRRQENPYMYFYIFCRNKHLHNLSETKIFELKDIYFFDNEKFVNFDLPIVTKEKYSLCDIALNYSRLIGKEKECECTQCKQSGMEKTCKIYDGIRKLFRKIKLIQNNRPGIHYNYTFSQITRPLACYAYYKGKHFIEDDNKNRWDEMSFIPENETYLVENLGSIAIPVLENTDDIGEGQFTEEPFLRRVSYTLQAKICQKDLSLKALQRYVSYVEKSLSYLFENFAHEQVIDLIDYLLYTAEPILRQFRGGLPEDETFDVSKILDSFRD